MRYPQEVIEELRLSCEIVDVIGGYVQLKNRGGNFFGLCPFHNEKSASFSVSPDKQMYYCFGCGVGGNVISFVMQIENFDFLDAIKFLAERVGFVLPQPQQGADGVLRQRKRLVLREIHRLAARFYYENLLGDTGDAARGYLSERGIDLNIQKRFGLGLSVGEDIAWDSLSKYLRKAGHNLSDMVESGLVRAGKKGSHYDRFRGRLMFPIMDVEGHVVGFGGRIMEQGDVDAAKYLNSPETPLFDKSRQLYGIHSARKTRSQEIVIVEGYMDVISIHQAGFPAAVGVLGTALGANHARLLKRINCKTALLLFDRDNAGIKAVERAIPVLLEAGIKVKCLQVNGEAKDPDEYIQKYGAARFGQLLDTAKHHAAFRIELLAREHDLADTEQRISFTQEAAAALVGIENSIEADAYIRETSRLSGIAPQAILTEMDKQRNRLLPHFSSSAAPRDRPGLRLGMRGQKNERGLVEARKGILSMLFSKPGLARHLQGHLSPEEMGEGIFPALLQLAYKLALNDRQIEAADVITHFEELEEQRAAAELLRDSHHFENDADMENALNGAWKKIKRSWLEQEIAKLEQTTEEIDINAVNMLGVAIRNLEKQYISITNG